MTLTPQPCITAPIAAHAASLFFSLKQPQNLQSTVQSLRQLGLTRHLVLGLGVEAVKALGIDVPGLIRFEAFSGRQFSAPATQHDLWLLVTGDNPSDVFDRASAVKSALNPVFSLADQQDTFLYRNGRDLTGYVDGTENPDPDTYDSLIFAPAGHPYEQSAMVTVQRWEHQLDRFNRRPQGERDEVMGRRLSDNEELEDAPQAAHVKRSAQENFSPEAFMLRRSMPWTEHGKAGLEFIAYANSLKPFEQIMNRMVGKDDGISDALFSFSTPVTGGHYWCPALDNSGAWVI